MTVTDVNIELLTRLILHVIYSQYTKELSMSVASVTMELLGRHIKSINQGVKFGYNYSNQDE